MADTLLDRQIDGFEKALVKVMEELNRNLQSVLSGSVVARDVYDANILLNSGPDFIAALRDAGYYDLAAQYVADFEAIPDYARRQIVSLGGPSGIKFSDVDATTFQTLARADLEQFSKLGEAAMDELRLGLVRDAISGQDTATMIDAIKAATVGTAKNGAPLANYAKTHANTALLNFKGEVTQRLGAAIGFDSDDSLWQVVGPNDNKTREVCRDALADGVKTKAEWIDSGYWGGTPGGWNCRHDLVPYFG